MIDPLRKSAEVAEAPAESVKPSESDSPDTSRAQLQNRDGVKAENAVSTAVLKANIRRSAGDRIASDGPIEVAQAKLSNPAVDQGITKALNLQQQGKIGEAVDVMKQVVHQNPDSAKAEVFMAKALNAQAQATKNPDAKEELQEKARYHYRHAVDLAGNTSAPDNAKWSNAARDVLREHAMTTPCLDQNNEGGAHPGGYCCPTSIRMSLRLEGAKPGTAFRSGHANDPGADGVAMPAKVPLKEAVDGTHSHSNRMYTPDSEGSTPGLAGERARELGLSNARFNSAGSLDDIKTALDHGRSVPIGGEGTFKAEGQKVFSKGTTDEHYFKGHWMTAVGYKENKKGEITDVIVNDPSTGQRLNVKKDDFLKFFQGNDGKIWMIQYGDPPKTATPAAKPAAKGPVQA